MWRNKKIILLEVLAVVVLVAALGVAAVAQADDEDANQVQNNTTSLMEKVAEIYQANTGTAIDAQELEKAFEQAHTETMTETRNQFLEQLVEEGKITQEQADEFNTWLDSRPDIPAIFGQANRGGMMLFGGMHFGRGGNGGGFAFKSGHCWSD